MPGAEPVFPLKTFSLSSKASNSFLTRFFSGRKKIFFFLSLLRRSGQQLKRLTYGFNANFFSCLFGMVFD